MDPNPEADTDPAIFVIDLQDAHKKLIFYKFFCLLLFEGTFTSFSKIKSPKKSQSSRNQGFLLFLLGDRRIRIQEAQKHVDLVDPDPQHCSYR
jgi:hypothetical protein